VSAQAPSRQTCLAQLQALRGADSQTPSRLQRESHLREYARFPLSAALLAPARSCSLLLAPARSARRRSLCAPLAQRATRTRRLAEHKRAATGSAARGRSSERSASAARTTAAATRQPPLLRSRNKAAAAAAATRQPPLGSRHKAAAAAQQPARPRQARVVCRDDDARRRRWSLNEGRTTDLSRAQPAVSRASSSVLPKSRVPARASARRMDGQWTRQRGLTRLGEASTVADGRRWRKDERVVASPACQVEGELVGAAEKSLTRSGFCKADGWTRQQGQEGERACRRLLHGRARLGPCVTRSLWADDEAASDLHNTFVVDLQPARQTAS
jgi:hypothetical protein